MLGDEISVESEAVAGAFNLDDHGAILVGAGDHGLHAIVEDHDNISQRNHPTLPDVLPGYEREDFGYRRQRSH